MRRVNPDFSDFRIRLISGIAIAVVGAGALLFGGTIFLALCGLIAGLIFRELTALVSPSEPVRKQWIIAAAAFAVTVTATGADFGVMARYGLIVIAPCLGSLFLKSGRMWFAIFGVAILLASGYLAQIRIDYDLAFVAWLIAVVAVTDISGYFGGKLVGGPLIAPNISGGKRWSGAIAGWLAAVVTGWVFAQWIGNWVIGASFAASATSQLADLAESWLKRRAGVKDSSALIPGHGGFFDRFDGLIGAAVCIWAMESLILAIE